MERMRLSKYHGLGNDFLVLVDAAGDQPGSAELARRVCDRHRGIGADGLIRVTASESAEVDLAMELWNADGSRAEMSGNGIRCMVHAAIDRGLAAGPIVRVATDAGIKVVSQRPSDGRGVMRFSVDMGAVKVVRCDEHEAEVDMGNPHLVILDADEDLATLGRRHPDVNVELVGGKGDEITMQVWERGVGETLACGTGACAAAAAMHAWGRTSTKVTVHQPGGSAEVELDGDIAVLTGPSQHIADIEIETEVRSA
jgi:diaminopimelate epimerase